ncbi:MAG: hypothetical protein V1767_01110 [Chloroflexota bacterium]
MADKIQKASPEQLAKWAKERREMGKTPGEIARMRNPLPEWFTDAHKVYLEQLYKASEGKCVVTRKECQGKWVSTPITVCRYLFRSTRGEASPINAPCLRGGGPLGPGEPCFLVLSTNADEINRGKQKSVSCESMVLGHNVWKCAYGVEMCRSAITLTDPAGKEFYIGERYFNIPSIYEENVAERHREIAEMSPMELESGRQTFGTGWRSPKTEENWLRRYWGKIHQDIKKLIEERETKAMHDLGEIPVRPSITGVEKRGRGSAIDLEVRGGEKKERTILNKVIAFVPGKPLQTYPAVRVRLNEIMEARQEPDGTSVWRPKEILVDISKAKSNVSTNAWHKAFRLGRPLPQPNEMMIEELVNKAVTEEKSK